MQEVLHRHALEQAASVAVETSSDEYTLSCVRAGLGVSITIRTVRGHFYRGLGVRVLRRRFGMARVGFLKSISPSRCREQYFNPDDVNQGDHQKALLVSFNGLADGEG